MATDVKDGATGGRKAIGYCRDCRVPVYSQPVAVDHKAEGHRIQYDERPGVPAPLPVAECWTCVQMQEYCGHDGIRPAWGSMTPSKHVHEDAYHDSDYSQVCKCGAVRLRASGGHHWEEWHICGLCALNPTHEAKHEVSR